MKRFLLTAAIIALLVVPASASAKIVELGAKVPRASVSCPTSCQAVGRVTGYQSRGGTVRDPFRVPRRGKIVAFTVRLGMPTAAQRTFFEGLYPGEPAVRISILQPGRTRRMRNEHTLLAQSPTYAVGQLFGTAPTFALNRPLTVRAGNIVAITVPTWAPMLAVSLANNFSWKSSRQRRRCDVVTQRAAQERLRSERVFGCSYSTARLYYTATYVPDPRPARR